MEHVIRLRHSRLSLPLSPFCTLSPCPYSRGPWKPHSSRERHLPVGSGLNRTELNTLIIVVEKSGYQIRLPFGQSAIQSIRKALYLNVPRCGIIAGDDNWMPLLDERGCRVVPQVPHQSQDLVGDGAHLHGDVLLPAGFLLSISAWHLQLWWFWLCVSSTQSSQLSRNQDLKKKSSPNHLFARPLGYFGVAIWYLVTLVSLSAVVKHSLIFYCVSLYIWPVYLNNQSLRSRLPDLTYLTQHT